VGTFDASARIRIQMLNASEMARRRWEKVPQEERSSLARRAALLRWANATESDFLAAKARAAIARQVRTRILAARLLGVDPSKLSNVKVEVLSSSEFRNRKSQEQAEYWKDLREKSLEHVAHVEQRRARTAAIVRPTSFRANGKESANRT
jgi:hypothetical protein